MMSQCRINCTLFTTILIAAVYGSDISYTVDMNSESKSIWAFWETSTTFDHGYQALRQDWRDVLLETHQDIGIQYVRFHETFDNDIGIVNPKQDPNDQSAWSYINIDKIYDFLLSIGMKPWIELDMMPSSFVPSNQVSNMYDHPVYTGPPSNMTLWSVFIKSFIQHITDRYGSDEVSKWYFEFWNEPQCAQNWYHQNLTSFEETYKVTAEAIKSVNKSYQIGGPATCGVGWIPEFPEWCKENKIDMNFISTHAYPADTIQTHDGYFQLLNNLSATIKQINPNWNVHITAYGPTGGSHGAMGKHDTSYNAAGFLTFASQFQALDSNQFGVMSFTGFSDQWDQSGVFSAEFHNNYGWTTQRGIHKPTYRALELLHKYATNRFYIIPKQNGNTENSTIELFVTTDEKKKEIVLFLGNWMPGNEKVLNETVMIDIINIEHNTVLPEYATIIRMDSENTNPAETWKNMGSPTYPTQQQMDTMIVASQTVAETFKIDSEENSLSIKVNVPVYGVVVLVIEID